VDKKRGEWRIVAHLTNPSFLLVPEPSGATGARARMGAGVSRLVILRIDLEFLQKPWQAEKAERKRVAVSALYNNVPALLFRRQQLL
jgi:hypothetical protein